MAWSKWVGGVAAFGVSFTALACTAEADLDESGEEQLSAQSANATTLACPGPSAFDTIPKGGKRAFVGGVMRFERSKCDSYGRCAPWTKVWETPITRTEESELRRETDVPEEQAKIFWLGRVFAETWTAWEGGDSVKYSVYASGHGVPRVDAAGRGQIEGTQSPSSYKGVDYGLRRTYGSYSTSYSDHVALYSLPMSIQVGSSCALLVQSVPETQYVARGTRWSLGNDGSRFRLVLKLDLEAASPAADGGTGAPDGAADGGTGAPDGAAGPRCGDKFSQKECWACCDAAHAAGVKTVERAQRECFCKASNCSAACGATACATTPKPADAACNTCLNDKYATCEPDWQKACAADPACVALAGCYDTCR